MPIKQKNEKVQVLERALKILDLLMNTKSPMGVNEIAKLQEITPSAAFRILKTLEAECWVYQCNDTKYVVGSKLSAITEQNNMYLALAEIAYPIMAKLTAQEVLPMNLVVRESFRFFILQQSRSTRYVDFIAPIGSNLPVHASGGGKVLLCELPETLLMDQLNSITFQSMTQNTITNRREFLAELEQVRKNGFALDYYESLDNTCCVAVPVRNNKNFIIAALSFSGITHVKSRNDLDYYVPLLKEAAQQISDKFYKASEELGLIAGEDESEEFSLQDTL